MLNFVFTPFRLIPSSPPQCEAGSRESLALVEDDCNIWDEGPDSEHNIRFKKTNDVIVVGATFNKLVERITSVTDHGQYHHLSLPCYYYCIIFRY